MNAKKKYLDYLQRQIKMLKKELKKLPSGKLVISKNGSYNKLFSGGKNGCSYIPSANYAYAMQLAKRQMIEIKLAHLLVLYNLYSGVISSEKNYSESVKSLIRKDSISQPLYSNAFNMLTYSKNTWANLDYDKSTKHPENLKFKSLSGQMVRSKSEAMIADTLLHYNIPYHYEEILTLDFGEVVPDFTILNPIDSSIVYWEHFGMFDDPDYVSKTILKIQSYIRNGIIPGKNLIMSFETLQHPFDSNMASEIIEKSLLL